MGTRLGQELCSLARPLLVDVGQELFEGLDILRVDGCSEQAIHHPSAGE